jgi:hypothetical protein
VRDADKDQPPEFYFGTVAAIAPTYRESTSRTSCGA